MKIEPLPDASEAGSDVTVPGKVLISGTAFVGQRPAAYRKPTAIGRADMSLVGFGPGSTLEMVFDALRTMVHQRGTGNTINLGHLDGIGDVIVAIDPTGRAA
jgi:hypothetical protein